MAAHHALATMAAMAAHHALATMAAAAPPPAAPRAVAHGNKPPSQTQGDSKQKAAAEMHKEDGEVIEEEQESNVLRYYTTQLMLRFVASDAYDPDGASFSEFGSTEHAPFLCIHEPRAPSSAAAALLVRTPSVVVIPSRQTPDDGPRLVRGIFTVIPAEGFEKDPGQPVYYNDLIELVDQRGRVLGIVSRSPFAGHLAADGHGGALVFVFERRTSRLGPAQNRINKHCERQAQQRQSAAQGQPGASDKATQEACATKAEEFRQKLGIYRRQSTRSSLVEICGGERLYIPGLVRMTKKQFPGECVVQHQSFRDSPTIRGSTLDNPEFLTCEVVLASKRASPVNPRPHLSNSSTATGRLEIADRTATGELVGVLHSGLLHRRTDHTKLWKKRFFVLTQVALHRFDASVSLDSAKVAKARGILLIKDCRSVKYDRFARPHEFDIVLNSGKLVTLHSVEALTCATWAAVLAHAIENPTWVHSERAYRTVWRSDCRYSSPRCPQIDQVSIRRSHRLKTDVLHISRTPQWSEKLSLGRISATGGVYVRLSDGNAFHLSLDDLSRALINPYWVGMTTSMDVRKMLTMAEESGVPSEFSEFDSQRSSSKATNQHEKSRFLIRLKYRSELQLDARLNNQRPRYLELAGLICTLVVLPMLSVVYYREKLGLVLASCGLITVGLVVAVGTLAAPVVWHTFWGFFCHRHTMESELHWFLMLLALEVRPHPDQYESQTVEERNRDRMDSLTGSASEVDLPGFSATCPLPCPFNTEVVTSIRTFRLENALDAILGRPQLGFSVIKTFFPHYFAHRDELGRRVLLIRLNAVNWVKLTAGNISAFNIARHFLYMWEFIWSYDDLLDGVAHSEILIVVDCRGWTYVQWFGQEVQLLLKMLVTIHCYYPNRLSAVKIIGDTWTFPLYFTLLSRMLPESLRGKIISLSSIPPALLITAIDPSVHSKDESTLQQFVRLLLSTYGNLATPVFTRREIEQATLYAKFGTLEPPGTHIASIDTRALTLPDHPGEWEPIYTNQGTVIFKTCISRINRLPSISFQSDAIATQWRGTINFRSTNAELIVNAVQDPAIRKLWAPDSEELSILDVLSRREDVCFWSRHVPFMAFSFSGHRVSPSDQTNAVFSTLVRRIVDVRRQTLSSAPEFTVLWKTTSAHRIILNRPPQHNDTNLSEDGKSTYQWRKLEDPYVSFGIVIEPPKSTNRTTNQISRGVLFHFWLQALAPPLSSAQNIEVAKLIEKKFRNLDNYVVNIEGA